MEKEFLPPKESLDMKELGFDEPCFGYYVGLSDNKEGPYKLVQIQSERGQFEWTSNVHQAPTFSQVFRWFRDNHQLEHRILRDSYGCRYQITKTTPTSLKDIDCKGQYPNTSYDEAEYNCIIKLIEEVKGEKHSSSKVKTLASVDVEKLEGIQKFVEYAVTESRFKQSLENVFPNDEPIDVKKMGEVIRWVVNDITKEEMDTMVANNIEPKDVNKYVSTKVREMFFKLS